MDINNRSAKASDTSDLVNRLKLSVMFRPAFFLLLASLLISSGAKADSAPLNLSMPDATEALRWALITTNLDTVERIGGGLLVQSSRCSLAERRQLMVKTCNLLASSWFSDVHGKPVADQFARKFLEADPEMDLKQKCELVNDFNFSPAPAIGQEQWASDRKERVGLIVGIWNQMATELKGFDSEKPTPFGSDPGAYGWTGNGDSEMIALSIQDPVERTTFRQRVFDYSVLMEKKMKNNFKLQRLQSFSRTAKLYLISNYTAPPYNLAELQQFLEPIDSKDEVKQQILSEVTKAMKARIDGVGEY